MGNPLDIGCPLCLVYTFLRLAISTSIRHFPYYIPKLCPERHSKDSEKNRIFTQKCNHEFDNS